MLSEKNSLTHSSWFWAFVLLLVGMVSWRYYQQTNWNVLQPRVNTRLAQIESYTEFAYSLNPKIPPLYSLALRQWHQIGLPLYSFNLLLLFISLFLIARWIRSNYGWKPAAGFLLVYCAMASVYNNAYQLFTESMQMRIG